MINAQRRACTASMSYLLSNERENGREDGTVAYSIGRMNRSDRFLEVRVRN